MIIFVQYINNVTQFLIIKVVSKLFIKSTMHVPTKAAFIEAMHSVRVWTPDDISNHTSDLELLLNHLEIDHPDY